MRVREKTSLFLAVTLGILGILPSGAFAQGGGVHVDEANFPDAAFRSWLRDPDHLSGAGADGFLSDAELLNVTRMDLPRQGIASLEGIGNSRRWKCWTVRPTSSPGWMCRPTPG